jgi:hypothetical protein
MYACVRHWRVFILAVALVHCSDSLIRLTQNRRDRSLARPQIPSEFYSRHLDCGGITIRAHRAVSRYAVQIACGKVNRMLRHIPNVRANLIAAGVEVHIVGRKQMLTDLPEFSSLKGKRDGNREWDRERGISGVTVVCAEENLLELPDDPYFSMNTDTCVHEFAHAIQLEGISKNLQAVIELRYKKALEDGLWRGQYASTNELEFFAETSTWYFGGPRPPARGGILLIYDTDGLMLYDAKTFALLDDIYEGRLEIGRFAYTPAKRIVPKPMGHSPNQPADGLLVFANQTASSFRLYLITREGQTTYWGELVPYEHRAVPSAVGYRWLLSDERDQPLSIFVPQTPYSYARL